MSLLKVKSANRLALFWWKIPNILGPTVSSFPLIFACPLWSGWERLSDGLKSFFCLVQCSNWIEVIYLSKLQLWANAQKRKTSKLSNCQLSWMLFFSLDSRYLVSVRIVNVFDENPKSPNKESAVEVHKSFDLCEVFFIRKDVEISTSIHHTRHYNTRFGF